MEGKTKKLGTIGEAGLALLPSDVKEVVTAYLESNKEVKLESAKLADGETVVEWEELAVGQPLFIAVDGERVPAPEGEHELEDGRVVVVSEEGIIAEVKEKVEESEEESMEDLKKKIADLEAQLESANTNATNLSTEKAELESQREALATKVEELDTKLSAIEAAPAADPSNPNPESTEKKVYDHNEYLALSSVSDRIKYKQECGVFY